MKTKIRTRGVLLTALVTGALFVTGCNLPVYLTGICSAPALIVNKTEDTNDGLCSETDCSIREAVITANSCSGTQTIQIPAGVYSLTRTGVDEEAADLGDLDLTDNVIIQGEKGTIVDGHAADRIFDIKPGREVSISDLVLQNGQVTLFGSAIANQGNLTINHVVLQNNRQTDPSGNGGTIFTYDLGSSLNISNSSVINNSAVSDAGGLYNVGGLMIIDNVTISQNQGYGVANVQGGQTQIQFSTIADDKGAYEVWNPGIGKAVEINNSIVSGRTIAGNCFQPLTSEGYNIDSAIGGTKNTCAMDGINDLINTDARLLPLADNGGWGLTRALDSDSPAINSANPKSCGGLDQRDIARPQGERCDRGAFELQNPPAAGATPTNVPIRITLPEKTATARPAQPNSFTGFNFTVNSAANCRKGPGVGFLLVTSFQPGKTLVVDGQNPEKTWVQVQIPASGMTCWANISLGSLSGSISSLPVLAVPAFPEAPASFTDSSTCEAGQQTVTLSWAASPNASGYNLYRKEKLLATLDALANSYDDTPPSGNGFVYSIEAFNEYGVSARVATTALSCP